MAAFGLPGVELQNLSLFEVLFLYIVARSTLVEVVNNSTSSSPLNLAIEMCLVPIDHEHSP